MEVILIHLVEDQPMPKLQLTRKDDNGTALMTKFNSLRFGIIDMFENVCEYIKRLVNINDLKSADAINYKYK